MSDEFMNETGGEQENVNTSSQDYGAPEGTNESSQTSNASYYSQPDYQQPQYDPNNLGRPDYSQMNNGANYGQNSYGQENYNPNYNQNGYQQNYNQAPYGQQPYGTATKSDSTGFGIASLVLGIVSIFTFFCCINYVLAIIAIILGIVQIVKSSKKGLAIGGIVTAGISIVGSILFWILIGSIGAQDVGPLQDYMEEYMQEYNNVQGESDVF